MLNNIEKMSTLERLLEQRLEKACEKNDWIASAKILLGAEECRLVLEKFSSEPIDEKDHRDAFMSLCDFIILELDVHYMEHEKVFAEDKETIPNTIKPYHDTIIAKLDLARWLKKVA